MGKGWYPGAARLGAVLLLVLAANAWASIYISAERYIYYWDWANYWLMFQELGALLRSDVVAALLEIRRSIATSDYNVLPILPLMPFELMFGPGRLSYILAITNTGVLPSAVLMGWIVERALGGRSWARALLYASGVLGLHLLWAPAFRGLPDVVGVAVACMILFVYFSDLPNRHSPKTWAGIGFLLCLLILTRRYYLFWAVGFFPGAVAAYLLGTPRGEGNRKDFLCVLKGLTIAGTICCALLLVFAAPLIIRIATTDYSAAYAAYRAELAGTGAAGQIVAEFGIALLVLCIAGLAWLAICGTTRRLGVLLIIQALLAITLFTRVQTLLGVQHYYLLVPAAGVGIAAAIAALSRSRINVGWRASGVTAILAVIALSSATVFSSSHLTAKPLMPHARYAPQFRDDLSEMQRLMATLAAMKADHIYVAASSQILNWSMLKTGCRDMQPDLCSRIEETPEIDMRDGFPLPVLRANYIVLATPTQYHVMPQDQQIVGLVARDIREGRGIGESFQRFPLGFKFTQGVSVAIYHRIAPLRRDAVEALSDELARSYPQAKHFFQPPISQ